MSIRRSFYHVRAKILSEELLYDGACESGQSDALRNIDLAKCEQIGEQNRTRAQKWDWETIAELVRRSYRSVFDSESKLPQSNRAQLQEKTARATL